MFAQVLAGYIGVEPREVERLLAMSRSSIAADAQYAAWRESLPVDKLFRSLEMARSVYSMHMPDYHKHLNNKYGMDSSRMSAYTLGNWLVTYLQFPNIGSNLPDIHKKLVPEAVVDLLPLMLAQLGEMPESGREWQRALAILALPLAAKRD